MTNITDSGVDSVPSISTFLVLESHGTNHILVSFDHSFNIIQIIFELQ